MADNNKAQLFLNGKAIEAVDWQISAGGNGGWKLTVTYSSGKKYTRPYEEWRIDPSIKKEEDLLYNRNKCNYTKVQSVIEIGYKYFVIKYPSSEKAYLIKKDNFELKKSTKIDEGDIFQYFSRVARERAEYAKNNKERIIAQSVVSQFNKIIPCDETVLDSYISRVIKKREDKEFLIYPFGVNETQMIAVKNAFASQISIVEGPPGTGKTQTILNIIANIIINGKTCAVVSNNNSAVENVYEKLEREKLGFLIAKLGSQEKREDFFTKMGDSRNNVEFEPVEKDEIHKLFKHVEIYLSSKNKVAHLENLLREIKIEMEYLEEWRKNHPEIRIDYIKKYDLNSRKTIDLTVFMKSIADKSLTLWDKWNLLIGFKIFRSKFLNDIGDRESFMFSLQYTYYEKIFDRTIKEKDEYERKLIKADFDSALEKLKNKSMNFLYQYVNHEIPEKSVLFTGESYKKSFDDFLRCYPIIGSSSHSLISSIGDGYLLDYVIIDEASQQDLVPGILCLGCARNVIVVGDRKQLPHIPSPTENIVPDEKYDCTRYSLLDSVCEVFCQEVPQIILKEHYRCHPKVIQFCNKQFYDDKLIPMTEDRGEDALSLVYTGLGNHMRANKNQREIESIMKVKDGFGYMEGDQGDGYTIGFIAPYNNQVNLAEQMLPDKIAENTVHKFQGRECNEIIFSTVLDKKAVSKRQLDFVDNAALVNVAVSRAKEKFTLVTGKDVFKENGKHIAALIRYIEYYAEKELIIDSPVISAFDLLYSEYDAALERLGGKLNPKDSKFKSEQIISQLLREIVSLEEFYAFVFHRQIYLKQLIMDKADIYSEREKRYIKNRASCDFVIYYRVGKSPLAVIEVDGGYHDKPEQRERDEIKNSILQKAKIPLLRLRTVDSEIKSKIAEFLKNL